MTSAGTWTLADLEALREGWDFEAKRASGRDGGGAIPHAFWDTYSAMANTRGGQVVLGLKERADGSFELHGLADAERAERELWNQLQNRQKVSANLLSESDVEHREIDGHRILVIHVPRARRQQRPVYLSGQWDHAYIRVGDGDRRMDRTRVRRMLADAEFDTRDDRVLPQYGVSDLDADSVKAFRNRFASNDPTHPWPTLDTQALLERIGAWRHDRETGAAGLTAAGLLFFGQDARIREVFPNYFVDYQERPVLDDVTYWSDRFVPDGKWSGNLFDFFLRAFPKLVRELKVPFAIGESLFRREDTAVHRAVREALVNTLIHADYEGRTSVLAVKAPEGFLFRNPGTLRVPEAEIRRGGTTDCRNRSLQRMFMLIGAGEQAGSGFGRILSAWREQHWRVPLIDEDLELETTTLRLSMASFLPQEVFQSLRQRFGARFTGLDEHGRLAMALADAEGRVTNRALQTVTGAHPRDLTYLLQRLVADELLVRHGDRQGAWYTIANPPGLPQTSPQTPPQTPPQTNFSPMAIDPVAKVAGERWARREDVDAAILELCTGRFRTARELGEILGREKRTISQNYTSRLVSEGRLEQKDPSNPYNPDQAYRTVPLKPASGGG